ncbi:MAG: AMP-binding protein, partial [Oscillospiraceae bacterium]|nr:AMP-binding protein [Oscillospiraceae bacterium]
NYIAGVPTLFEALLRLPKTEKLDLSPLRGVFSGGDSMLPELKARFDAFLAAHGAEIAVREGYGLTECVTACCLTPKTLAKDGSIGVPFRDTLFKIVGGEICISGPTVMLGYDDDEEETKTALRLHDDGKIWLHTGDLGEMDADGFVYFKGRIKRMIVSSGYSVYPYHVENILQKHALVRECCVVGVPDDYRMQRVKAFIVLESGADAAAAPEELRRYSREALAPYNRPREFEFVAELPKTLVGKIAYSKLQPKAEA